MTQDRMYLKGDDDDPTFAERLAPRRGAGYLLAALTGRARAAETQAQDDQRDARRELAAVLEQLGAAQQQIVRLSAERDEARRRADAEAEECQKFRRLFTSEQLENRRLVAQSVAAFGRTVDPPPGLRAPAASDADRRALHVLADQLALLEGRRVLGQPVDDLGEIRRGLTVLAEHAPDLAMDLQQAAARLSAFLRGER